MNSRGGVIVTMIEDSTLVRLDFGEYGRVDVPPEVAMTMISDEKTRTAIRVQSNLAHRKRQQIAAQMPKGSTDPQVI